MKNNIKNLVISALCLALCLVLPFLTGQIPELGNMLCPMHLPVMLCGFICGGWWGFITGLAAPIMRSLIFGMPVMFPGAVSMAFELAAYGAVTGVLYRLFPKKPVFIYASLLIAMISGRIVWAIVRTLIMGIFHIPFTAEIFLANGIINAWPGMILQIILIPVIITALHRSGMIRNSDLLSTDGK